MLLESWFCAYIIFPIRHHFFFQKLQYFSLYLKHMSNNCIYQPTTFLALGRDFAFETGQADNIAAGRSARQNGTRNEAVRPEAASHVSEQRSFGSTYCYSGMYQRSD